MRDDEITDTLPDDVQEFLDAANAANSDTPPKELALLKIWLEVLSNVEAVMSRALTMAEALHVTKVWPQLKIQDVAAYHFNYHSDLLVMRRLLEEVIATDDECLKREGADDIDNNRHHYLNLLTLWQRQMLLWEESWNSNDSDAHIWMAAHLSVGEFIFGEKGLVRHLDARGFELSDEEAQAIWADAQEV